MEMAEIPKDIASPDVNDSEQELLNEGNERASDSGEGDSVSLPGQGKAKPEKPGLRPVMNLLDATAFFVGGTIGSGIFITPATIHRETGSVGVSMLCWLVGTIIAVLGGLCYVELGLLIPDTGGEYAYITRAYSFRNRNKWLRACGSLLGFLFVWTSIVVVRPASSAIIILTCSRYLIRPLYLDCEIPENVLKILALFVIILQAGVLIRGVKLMAHANNVTTLLKVLSVVFIVLVGVVGLIKRGSFPEDSQHPFQGSSLTSATDVGGMAIAIYAVMWAYSGWNLFSNAVEEIKRPEKNLPRAMVAGLIIISSCYFLVNLSFYSVLSYHELLNTQAVALPFGESVMGKAGLVIIPLFVAISTFGANLSNIFMSSRLLFSSAREGQMPAILCGVHRAWHTPIAAIFFHTIMSAVYIVSGNVESLIEAFNAANWVFFGMVFVGLLIMRVTLRHDKRPFKVWLALPIVMVIVSVFLVGMPLASELGPSMGAFAVILSGTPVYCLLVMESPWRLRPIFLDKLSDFVTEHGNMLFNAESAR